MSEIKLPMIIVHGGAGKWKDKKLAIALPEVEKAARIGFGILAEGGSALDAAEGCTYYMEGCGKLNAGISATVNVEGVRELDAMIVDGSTITSGAVMAITDIAHPISLARYVMECTPHSQFAADGAKKIYQKMIEEGYRKEIETGATGIPFDVEPGDTVGCVTIDMDGKIAATSSTGGTRGKLPGRVGDSPILGAGAYANDICGVSTTGEGEHIIRVTLARTVTMFVEEGLDVKTAAQNGIRLMNSRTQGRAGLVVADKNGDFAFAKNSRAMPTAVIQGNMESFQSFSGIDSE